MPTKSKYMDENAKKKFLEVKGLFKRLSDEMCLVVESYYIWTTLTFSRSIPEVGEEEANKNANIMSIHKDFFIPTEESHLRTFVIGLMKFFDKDTRALSLDALIQEIGRNKDIFTPEVLRQVYPELAKIGAIEDDYVPIDEDVINKIEKLKKQYESVASTLKDLRDKKFAHSDRVTVIKGEFVPLEVEKFIEAVQEMFNKLSGKFDLSSTTFDHLKEDSIRNTMQVLEDLGNAEKIRQAEFQRKYG